MKQKEYRTVWITRHMRAGMLAAGLLLPLVAGAAALFSGGNGLDIRFCFGSLVRILDVVTICMTGARRIATGGTNVVSEPART